MSDQEWRPPVYGGVVLVTNNMTMICEFCGALVWDATSHTEWHRQLWVALLAFDEKVKNG